MFDPESGRIPTIETAVPHRLLGIAIHNALGLVAALILLPGRMLRAL